MKIESFSEGVDYFRKEKTVYIHFQEAHRILSTCRVNGGLRDDLNYLLNHQCCEPTKHSGTDLVEIVVNEPERYLQRITSKAGIDSQNVAILSTAANMNNAAIARAEFEGLQVIAVCTAGVSSNAGAPGDPAAYAKTTDGYQILKTEPPKAGTINIMLCINQELTAAAMVTAATVVTEAKTHTLHQLSVRSCYSEALATGTGTDQIGIASQLGTAITHTDANKHSKLGELIGQTTQSALRQALNLQSGITPDSRRSSLLQLERFGETQEQFIEQVTAHLPEAARELFKNNFLSINHDPVTVGAVQACIHIRDQFTWGVLPHSCARDTLFHQASLITRAVSGKPLQAPFPTESLPPLNPTTSSPDFLSLIHHSFAQGFTHKWHDRFKD